jgi:acetylornithine deacetylase/succinyl-diaminopimelate desuccinylase-like protein
MAELSLGTVRARVERAFRDTRADLEELVRIPSVSADESAAGEVRKSAEATRAWLRRSGLKDVELLEVDGAHPAVFGTTEPSAGTPTVLLYAHHDVQPPGPRDRWISPPFEPTERAGRLFGRGTADDKAGIAVHAAALRAWEGRPPVSVAVFIEGECEGKPHRIDASGRAFEAFRRACIDTWGRAPVEPGSGGSLPVVAAFAAAYPETELLLTGVEDFESNAHSEIESVHLGEFQNCCVNEAMLLGHLAAA